jgi:hypothetical protein
MHNRQQVMLPKPFKQDPLNSFIISMIKLLDAADWLRGVKLFQTKWRKSILNTNVK